MGQLNFNYVITVSAFTGVVSATLRSPAGNFDFCIPNKQKSAGRTSLRLPGLAQRYMVLKWALPADFIVQDWGGILRLFSYQTTDTLDLCFVP